MTLAEAATKAGQFKALWAALALCGAGVVLGADTVRHAKEVPTLKELAQEQREANSLMRQQVEQQQKMIDLLIERVLFDARREASHELE